MNTFVLVLRNIAQRKFSIFLTGLSVALGVALIASTLNIKKQVEENFNQTSVGYEMIVGAKGSPLQLVLHTVYQLGIPVGNIDYTIYDKVKHDRRVAYAIPYALGDNYKGFKIVGTSEEVFTKFNYRKGAMYEFDSGKPFAETDTFKAVIGSAVAAATGLKVGDQFVATHGLQESGGDIGMQHDATPLTVVGILKRTGTANDKLVYCTLETVWAIHEKPEAAAEKSSTGKSSGNAPATKDTDAERGQVTAVILKIKAPLFALQLYRQINDGVEAQAAIPTNEIKSFFDIIGNVDWAFLLITALVIVVALIGVAVAIYNSLNERRREIAILRSLGAHRMRIFGIITLEAAMVSFLGSVAGLVFSKVLVLVIKGFIAQKTGVEVAVQLFTLNEFFILAGVTLIGSMAGMLPAINAYKTDVARNLSPIS
jgi:putative ABC transport system permease protein